MIIVEGPDNSGKSTLIQNLLKDYTIELFSTSKGPIHDLNYFERKILETTQNLEFPHLIMDRCSLLSEEIYGPTLRSKNLIDELEYPSYYRRKLYSSLSQGETFLIYCRPPKPILLDFKNHQVKEHDTQEHLNNIILKAESIIEAYDTIVGPIANFIYDYTSPEAYNLLTKTLNERYFKNECK